MFINKKDIVIDDYFLGREKYSYDKEAEINGVKEMIDALSDEELDQLREKPELICFFRAGKGDTQRALKKLRTVLEWRKEFDVEIIMKAARYMSLASASKSKNNKENVEVVEEKKDENDVTMNEYMNDPRVIETAEFLKKQNGIGKCYVRGYDADGRANLILRPANDNSKDTMKTMRNVVYHFERALACTARQSMIVDKANGGIGLRLDLINLVVDYTGFHLSQVPPMSSTKYFFDILQKHYPERLYRCYVLNPPVYFRTFWALIKPLVNKKTRAKLVVCPNTKTGMKPFHEAIGEKNLHKLEEFAGGNASPPVKMYNADEYYDATPFDRTFDEKF